MSNENECKVITCPNMLHLSELSQNLQDSPQFLLMSFCTRISRYFSCNYGYTHSVHYYYTSFIAISYLSHMQDRAVYND